MVKWLYLETDVPIPEFGKPIELYTFGNDVKPLTLEDMGKEGWVLADVLKTTGFYLRFIFKKSVS